MTITYEVLTKNGMIRTNTIREVIDIKKENGVVLKGFNKDVFVIWLTLNKRKSFPLAFSTEQLRDHAFSVLSSGKPEYYLDLHEYYYYEYIPIAEVRKLLGSWYISIHLAFCYREILEREKINVEILQKKDAAKMFSVENIREILEYNNRTKIIADEASVRIWAKTLFMPPHMLKMGVTPHQFFKTISENEKSHSARNSCIRTSNVWSG